MTNLSDRTNEIETGDRIAQVLFVRKEEVEFEEVATFDETDIIGELKVLVLQGNRQWQKL